MREIFDRVSIRRFTDQAVEGEKLEALLRAAMAAPSAGNQQPWEFYVVTDRAMLRSLAKASPYAGCAANAPAAIVSAYRTDSRLPEYAQIDMSIAMENLWLATLEQGLGGVWLGIAPIEERMRAVEEIVGLPATQRAFAVFPVGYPAESCPQQNRFEPERIHYRR